jgi:hypothetical protein
VSASCVDQQQKGFLLKAIMQLMQDDKWKTVINIDVLKSQWHPLDQDKDIQLIEEAGFKITKVNVSNYVNTFENIEKYKQWVKGWMGGFSFVAHLKTEDQEALLNAVMKHIPTKEDGSIEYTVPKMCVHAIKQ